MNINPEEKFTYTFETMRNTSLSQDEREEMRANIRFFMAEHPVKQTFLEWFFASKPSSVPGVSYMRPALAGLLIVMLISGGTSFAAADALPGDLLYTIKTRVNEPIQEVLAVS